MKYYRVSLHEEQGDNFVLFFDCQADDPDHAAEQAEDMYRDCEIVNVTEILRDMYYSSGGKTAL